MSGSKGTHAMGWRRDKGDYRDRHMLISPATVACLPVSVDLRPQCPPVLDQGQLGSCTANAIASALQFDQMKQQLPTYTPSRLYIYWNERDIEGSTDYDSGAEIRDGFKSLRDVGYCKEDEWPYSIDKFTQKPPDECFNNAKPMCGVAYARLMQLSAQLRGCLASGTPFVFGVTVYESFESKAVEQTGIVPLPGSSEGVIGGHCMLACGYDDSKQQFTIQNSWGTSYGDKGFLYIPYAYMFDPNLASDTWVVQHVFG